MLAAIRRLQSTRLHLLAEHGRLSRLSDAACADGPASFLALLQSTLPGSCKPFATTGASLPDEEEPQLHMPDDLAVIAKLNPQLRDVILAHKEHERSSARGALRTRLQELVHEADPSASPSPSPSPAPTKNLTKTSLLRVRVDRLRSVLVEENADSRGNKDALVARLLALVRERDAQEGGALPAALDEHKGGVVTRKQVSQERARAQRRGQTPATYGIPEAQLAAERSAAAEGSHKAAYAEVFKPEQLAEMLLEARAEEVCIIDVRKSCAFTDYFVLGTASSQRLVRSLAAGVLYQLKERCKEVAPGVAPAIEGGKEDSEWQVVDAGSCVVHIFLDEYRQEVDLEGLWGRPDGSNLRFLQPKQRVQTLQTIK